jgi:hypothetical protein
MSCSAELRRLTALLGLTKANVMLHGEPGGSMSVEKEFDVCPEEFVVQAQMDFESGGNARRLNSLVNSKRAIQAQVDRLILRVGFDPKKLKTSEKWTLLRDIGFVAPRILKRANEARNRLEHEYISPSDNEVEDALDLAMLFIESGERGVSSFSLGARPEYRGDGFDFEFKNELSFAFGFRNSGFTVWAFKDTPDAPLGKVADRPKYNVGEMVIGPEDPIYVDLVRIGIAVDQDIPQRIEPAVSRFFDSLR